MYHSSPGTAAAVAGTARPHITRALFIVRTSHSPFAQALPAHRRSGASLAGRPCGACAAPLGYDALQSCSASATTTVAASHRTDNVEEMGKFPLWRECSK